MPASRDVDLRDCFADPLLDGMTFLNHVISEFPSAISFAPGRPLESLFDIEAHMMRGLAAYVESEARRRGVPEAAIWGEIGQYSRTNGVVGDVIAEQLARDEGIHVDAASVIVTVGAQEAMAIAVAGLFDPAHDILLVSDPTYVGITGLARLLGIRVVPIPVADEGLDPDVVEHAIARASREGRVRALHVIPDFNNPLGTSLSMEARRGLLRVCHRHRVLIIEDNAYGMYNYDRPRLPTLKALDTEGDVLYVGSVAKTLFPGLRLGYLVADQRVTGTGETLAVALARVKNLLTVNTSPLMQAVFAGALRQSGGSLEPIVAPKREQYRKQRDAMIAALDARFPPSSGQISWRRPEGGFFLPVVLPFTFGTAELRQCALDYGVIVCPMRLFCIGHGRANQIRLAFSYVTPEEIDRGIERLARFVRARTTQAVAAGARPASPS